MLRGLWRITSDQKGLQPQVKRADRLTRTVKATEVLANTTHLALECHRHHIHTDHKLIAWLRILSASISSQLSA